MLNDEICKLREKLNDSILNGQDYERTYQISIELDQLIAEYYKTEMNLSKTKRTRKEIKRKIENK